MHPPDNAPPFNKMPHPIPQLQPNQQPQNQPHYEDDHAEKKRKAHTLTKSSFICLERNHQINVEKFTCRTTPETPVSPACFNTDLAGVTVNSLTFKQQDFLSPGNYNMFFKYTDICNLTFTITNQATNINQTTNATHHFK